VAPLLAALTPVLVLFAILTVQLDMQECVAAYQASGRRLIVLGYNATLTTNVDVGPGGRAGAGAAGTRRYVEGVCRLVLIASLSIKCSASNACHMLQQCRKQVA
jgi:hypothetical protein